MVRIENSISSFGNPFSIFHCCVLFFVSCHRWLEFSAQTSNEYYRRMFILWISWQLLAARRIFQGQNIENTHTYTQTGRTMSSFLFIYKTSLNQYIYMYSLYPAHIEMLECWLSCSCSPSPHLRSSPNFLYIHHIHTAVFWFGFSFCLFVRLTPLPPIFWCCLYTVWLW